jgi:hypothetical protein
MMKIPVSQTALLACMNVLAIVAAICAALAIRIESRFPLWGPLAIAAVLAGPIRRLRSRRLHRTR